MNFQPVDQSELEEDSYTVSYSFDLNQWVCFHDYVGDYRFGIRNLATYSFNGQQIYKHGAGKYGEFYGKQCSSYITPVHRKEKDFLLEGVSFTCDMYSDEVDLSKRLLDKTISSLSFHNSYQSTTEIPLLVLTGSIRDGNYNIRRVFSEWYFNKIKDAPTTSVIEKFDEQLVTVGKSNKKKFIDNFVIVKLLYDNIGQLSMQFSDIDFNTTDIR